MKSSLKFWVFLQWIKVPKNTISCTSKIMRKKNFDLKANVENNSHRYDSNDGKHKTLIREITKLKAKSK